MSALAPKLTKKIPARVKRARHPSRSWKEGIAPTFGCPVVTQAISAASSGYRKAKSKQVENV